ncbi:MAG: cupin [Verrucomicrobiota bacterium]
MPTLILAPSIITAAGQPPKRIEEFIGRVNSQTDSLSVARMTSPAGWIEPGQTPEFEEFTVVLRGMLRIESKTGILEVAAGSAVITKRGEWVRYSTPQGAEYIAVCLPAFSPSTVNRDR